ncbi:MAG TPA: 30S ribosomal protein S20 [bacterium]|nr:30S ribosomal protein S20 [bacterium]
MPKQKSAIKRLRQSKEQRARNRIRKTKMKSTVKKLNAAIGESPGTDNEKVVELYRSAASVIAKTSSKGTIHRNTAARKISRLTKAVNKAIGADGLAGEQPKATVASLFEAESVPEAPVSGPVGVVSEPVVEKPEPAESPTPMEDPSTRDSEAAAEPNIPPDSQEGSGEIPEEQETAPETATEPNASESEELADEQPVRPDE